MKILNHFGFAEKLRINPVSSDEFDNIKIPEQSNDNGIAMSYKKSNIQYMDMVKINGWLFITFIGDSIRVRTEMFDNNSQSKNGVFFSYTNEPKFVEYSDYIFMDNYDMNLKHKYDSRYDVTDVYKVSKNLPYVELKDTDQSHLIYFRDKYYNKHFKIS